MILYKLYSSFLLILCFISLVYAQETKYNIDSLKKIDTNTQNIETQIKHHIAFAEAYHDIDNQLMQYHAKIALEKSKKYLSDNPNKETSQYLYLKSKYTLADAFTHLGQNHEAISYLEEVLQETPKNQKLYITTLQKIGQAHFWVGYKETALRYFLQVMEKIGVEQEDFLASLGTYQWIARIYTSQKFYDKAIFYLQKEKAYFDKINLTNPSLESEIGNVFFYKKEYQKAYNLYENAYLHEKNKKQETKKDKNVLENAHALGFLSNNMGLVRFKEKKYEQALQKYKDAIQYFEKSNSKRDFINTQSNISQLYAEQKNYQEAINIAKNAYLEAKNIKDYPLVLEICNTLIGIYKAQNQKEELYFYQTEKIQYQDTTTTLKQEKEVLAVDLYEKNVLKQKENKNLQDQNQSLFYMLFWGVMVILGLFVMIFFVIRANSFQKKYLKEARENEKLQIDVAREATLNATFQTQLAKEAKENEKLQIAMLEEEKAKNEAEEKSRLMEQKMLKEKVDTQNRQLASQSALISQKTEWLLEIENLLKNQWDSMELEERIPFRNAFKNIFIEIKQKIDTENDWQKYKQHFEDINPNFFDKIKNLSEKITQHDLRICAYLKMNLSIKEIAQMLQITPDSLKVGMSRLKKKINLLKEQDFRDFLDKI